MTQQIINVGEVANDGTGESLRTAFEAVNNNFSQIWASGPVNSNVVIANNVISTTPVNTPLVLAPGGIGNVQSNAHVIPGVSGVYDLGAPNRRWDSTFSDYYYGNGFFLTGIQVANVGSLVNGNSNVFIHGPDGVITVSVDGVANIATFTPTGVSILGNVIASGNSEANYFIGNGAFLTGIVASGGASIDNGNSNVRIAGDAANVTVGVSGVGNVAIFTPTGLQVTNTINATTIVASGNVNANRFNGNGAGLFGVVGANIVGPVGNAQYANTASTAGLAYIAVEALQANIANHVAGSAQPNITSVGNLTSLTVTGNASANNLSISNAATISGNLSAGNANLGNTAQAAYFVGNGALLTGIQATVGSRIENGTSNINIPIANGNITVGVGGTGNITTFSTSGVNVVGTVNATNFQGNGALLTSITGANVTGNVPRATYAYTAAQAGLAYLANTVIDNAQPNITSVGILNSLSVTGNVTGNYYYGNGRFLTGIQGTGGGGNVTFANISPGQPNVGDVWIQANTGTQFIYFNDSTSNQWAEMEAYISYGTVVNGGIGNTGNIGFSNVTMYSIDGLYVNNSDLFHGATASLSLPPNGSGDVSLLNYYGNIIITSGTGPSATKSWRFDPTGDLIGQGKLTAGNVSYTNVDGTAGQTLKTYGNGQTYWGNAGTGGSLTVYLRSGTMTEPLTNGDLLIVGRTGNILVPVT